MVQVLRTDFSSVLDRLPCHLSKDPLKWYFLYINLTTYFGVRKFKYSLAVRVVFFLKIFKVECKFWKCKKKLANIFRLLDNCIWKCCKKFPLLRTGYLSLAVNGSTNSPKILHITQRDFINLNSLHRD